MLSRKGPATALSSGSKKWDGTVAGDRGNKSLDIDVVRLLKTQDMGYIRSARNLAMKEVRTLEERVIALGGDGNDLPGNDEDESDKDGMDLDLDFDDDESSAKKKKKPAQKAKKIIFSDGRDEREDQIRQDAERNSPDRDDDGDDDDGGKAAVPDGRNPEKRAAEQKRRLLLKLQRRLQNSRKKQSVLAKAEHELEIQRAKMAKTATIGGVTKSGKKFKVRERKR